MPVTGRALGHSQDVGCSQPGLAPLISKCEWLANVQVTTTVTDVVVATMVVVMVVVGVST